MKNKNPVIILAAAGTVFAAAGLNNKLKLVEYTVRSEKIMRPVNIVFLSDIHSQKYKDDGQKLFEIIDSAEPDCVIFGGDIVDKYSKTSDDAKTYTLLQKMRSRYKNCYYVTGNHEFESGKADAVRARLEPCGFRFLGDESYILEGVSGQKIIIGGVDYDVDDAERIAEQKAAFIKEADSSGLFSVFVRHVPMFCDDDGRFDLILSGHNHGGLWRLPNTDIGVAGGGKKLFPKYVHGEYNLGGTSLIVGSGITTSTYLLPRIYNQPEILKISLQPVRRV